MRLTPPATFFCGNFKDTEGQKPVKTRNYLRFVAMDSVYKSLLLRYQNYFIEFYQLLEDKAIIKQEDTALAEKVKHFLTYLPDLAGEFELELDFKSQTGELENHWQLQLSHDGLSVRSFTVDGLDETDEWYFHYRDDTKEYEGNLFTDGDWDLFLEEVAEVDDFDGQVLSVFVKYEVAD